MAETTHHHHHYVCNNPDLTPIKEPDTRLVPAQDVPYALILWYVAKTIYLL